MVCVPSERLFRLNEPPVPSTPSRLLVQTSEPPVSCPSSGSEPVPVNVTSLPSKNSDPEPGRLIVALGDWLAGVPIVTCFDAVAVNPPASATVSVTVYTPGGLQVDRKGVV